MPLGSLLNEYGVEPDDAVADDDLQETADDSAEDDVETEPPGLDDVFDPPGEEIPVREFEEDPSEDQFDALEEVELADPFTLAVENPELAGGESTNYAVTAFYDEFDESPNDRLSGPTTPLDFDEDGIAAVTIGSAGTDADVSTGFAFGPIGSDATLVNNIEVPEGTEAIAVEVMEGNPTTTMTPGVEGVGPGEGAGVEESGEFTEEETVGE